MNFTPLDLNQNDYGQYDHLIETLAPALGSLDHLKARLVELCCQ